MSNTAFGVLLLVFAGAMNGSFTLPMKVTRKWAWENTWLAWSIFALGIFPLLLAFATVPFLGEVYAQAGVRPIAIAAGCGAGWGVAQVFFGLAVDAVGIALAFSVILGISAAVGALIPICLGAGPSAFSAEGLFIIAGVALVIIGVLVCAKAGRAREAALRQGPTTKPAHLTKGHIFCILSGLGAAMVALGLQYGSDLSRIAEHYGAAPLWSNNATWLPLMLGGAIPNIVYCVYLISKNKTRNRFGLAGTGAYWLLAGIMALFWFGSTVMYGISTNSLGIVVAWPTFMSLIVITAMVCGVATGEWNGSGSKPLRVMYGGLAVLVLSIVVLSSAKSRASDSAASITLAIDTTSRSYAIPNDFVGLSFETASVLPNRYGVSGYFFSPADTQVIMLFQNIGLKNLRVGGGTCDTGGKGGYCVTPVTPTRTDIDNLFEFARAAGVKVTYSLRLSNPSACANPHLASDDAATALYIWNRYRANLHSFSIGNEPDWHAYHTYAGHGLDPAIYETLPGTPGSAYASFISDWRKFANNIVNAVPNATFSAPDTGAYSISTYTPNPSSGVSWTQQFARDEKTSGMIRDVTQHHYVGGGPGNTTAEQGIDNMLSAQWVNGTSTGTQLAGTGSTTTYTPYPWIYNNILAPVLSSGLSYRMTEANDYLRGVAGASDAFSSALWALDYMHWWAAHGAAGVNFHNNPWLLTDTIAPNPRNCPSAGCDNYYVAPKGYGMKAFDLGSHGFVEPIAISNPEGINLTAYAVGDSQNLYVTIINKTHSSTNDSTDANVTILPAGLAPGRVTYMELTDGAPGNASLLTATLGGTSISNNERWLGRWTPLNQTKGGKITLTVQAGTAVIVRIHSA